MKLKINRGLILRTAAIVNLFLLLVYLVFLRSSLYPTGLYVMLIVSGYFGIWLLTSKVVLEITIDDDNLIVLTTRLFVHEENRYAVKDIVSDYSKKTGARGVQEMRLTVRSKKDETILRISSNKTGWSEQNLELIHQTLIRKSDSF